MPEFRRNPITGDWVLYAPERAARPNEYRAPGGVRDCPFCPGNERLTPPELAANRPEGLPPDSPGWRWRIFPNKFPALHPGDGDIASEPRSDDWRAAAGHHEVLIETPRHDGHLPDLSDDEAAEALGACKERIAALSGKPAVRSVVVFKNHGQGSGASLRHPHFQIAALPFVPQRIENQLDRARVRFEQDGACVFCELMERETREGPRSVHAGGEIAVVAPYAARFPAETWIMPRIHTARFEESPGAVITAAATALRKLVSSLNAWVGDTPYHLVIHTAPARQDCSRHYHWRIEMIPRLTGVAGLEWATGIHLNQVTPEHAAKQLRAHWP